MRYGFVIDNRKCIGCHACTVACKSEHNVPLGVNRTHVKYIEKGVFPNSVRKFSVHRCNHCSDAPCAEICPTSALYSRADGIVDFDNDRCIGCKSCMQACPYDALYIDPQTQTAAKCNYCSHRVDEGFQPACVVVCPVEAIVSGDLDAPTSKIAQLVASRSVTVRKPEKNTQPNLFYVEGDAHMLNPTTVPKESAYLFSEQSGGVGHFASRAGDAGGTDSRVIGAVSAHLNTDAGAGKRVYDAPSKGLLWGWEVPAYLCTKAVAVGIFLVTYLLKLSDLAAVSAATELKVCLTSLVFLTLTAALLVKDLDRPDRFLYVLLRPNPRSWLVRGAYIITGFGLVVTVMTAGLLLHKPLTMLALPGLLLAVLGAVYTAFLLAQAKARDLWQSPLASVHMLTAALLSGAVLLGLLDASLAPIAGRILAVLLPLNLGLIALEVWTPHVSADAAQAVHLFTHGRFARTFYTGLVLGNLVPLVLLLTVGAPLLPLAGLLVLAGIAASEYLRVTVPQMIPLS